MTRTAMPHAARGRPDTRRTAAERRALLLVTTGLLHDALGHLFRRAHLRSQAAFAKAFDGVGISPLQYGILELAMLNPGITHSEIAEAMVTAPSVVTTAMKPLLDDGLLEKRADHGDGRCVGCHLTQAGQDFMVMFGERILDAEALLLAPLSPAQRRSLKRLLQRLAQAPKL